MINAENLSRLARSMYSISLSICVCVEDAHALLVVMRFSFFLSCFLSSYTTFPSKYLLASSVWKQAGLNWNFNTIMYWIVSVHVGLLYLPIWSTLLGVLSHQICARANISNSSKLLIALLLQGHCARTSQPIVLQVCGRRCVGIPAFSTQTEFLFTRNSRI